MKNQTTNGFAGMSIPDLSTLMGEVITQMTIHVAYFPAPLPTLPQVQALKDDMDTAAGESAGGDKYKLITTAEKKAAAVDGLQRLGVYVNLAADGNRDIAIKSGLPVRALSVRRVIAPLDPPSLKRTATVGQLAGKIKNQKGCTGCTWYITDNPSLPLSQWTAVTAKTKIIFENLTPGVVYTSCVIMDGPRGQKVTSPTAQFTA